MCAIDGDGHVGWLARQISSGRPFYRPGDSGGGWDSMSAIA